MSANVVRQNNEVDHFQIFIRLTYSNIISLVFRGNYIGEKPYGFEQPSGPGMMSHYMTCT